MKEQKSIPLFYLPAKWRVTQDLQWLVAVLEISDKTFD